MSIPLWTDVSNTFVLATTTPHSTRAASAQYAQGGPYASSEIKQDVALPDGYGYGVAVLTFQRMTTITGDTGTVTLEALSAGGTVLASATTGAETTATLDVWYERRLTLTLPTSTATLRVRLLASRAAGSGNSGACFDDFALELHKALEPVAVLSLDFTAPSEQPTCATWQDFHRAWPDLSGPPVVIAQNVLAISHYRQYSGQTIAWSDGLTHTAGVFTGLFSSTVAILDAFAFTRAVAASAVDVQVSGGSTERGAFASDASFTVRVVFKVDEPGFSTACGIVGRRSATGIGWGLALDATGRVQAVLQGVSGTKTATSAGTVIDGAPHCTIMVYDAVADTLRIYVDRRGYVETSTAAGMGEFANTTATLRIGRDSTASETFTGQILEVELIATGSVAHTQAEIESTWTYADDPTNEIDTYTRTAAAWGTVGRGAGAAATAVACFATDQVAVLQPAAGSDFGLATCPAITNLVSTFDVTQAAWEKDASTTKTTGQVDVTGFARAALWGIDATNGFRHAGMTVSATSKIGVTFWGKAASGSPTINVRLKTSTGVVKDTVPCIFSALAWVRFDVEFDAWDGATATCSVEWISASGAASILVAHPVAVYQPATAAEFQVPPIIPAAGATFTGGVWAQVDHTFSAQLSHEGELEVRGVGTTSSPGAAGVALVRAAATTDNLRALSCNASQVPEFALYDGAGVLASTSESTQPCNWQSINLRGRWSRANTLDNAAAYGGLYVVNDALTYGAELDHDQVSAWTDDAAVPLTQVYLGAVAATSVRLAMYLQRCVVRSPHKQLRYTPPIA